MPVLAQVNSLFRNLFRKTRIEKDLDEEIGSHLELLTDQKIEEGMNPQDARRAARIELGGVEQIKENVRAVRAGVWFETMWQDLRFGVRMLRKNPSFFTVAVLTLTLGIGVNTAIFAVVNGILLRPLPYPHSERIVKVGSAYKGVPYSGAVIDGPHYQFLRQYSRTFESVEANDVITSGVNVSGSPESEHLVSAAVSAGFFRVLDVEPAMGHAFTEEEDRPGGPCAVVLTNGLWRLRYAGDPLVVGRSITVNEQSCLVTGVLPRNFSFDGSPDILMPTRIPPTTRDVGHSYSMLARLKPGATLDQARAEMQSLFTQFKTSHGDLVDQAETGISVEPYLDSIVGDVRPSLWLLFGAVSLLLLIACANVASLLLSRAATRASEIAIRSALGAGRRRLTRQLVTESAVLAFVGAGLGLLLARWGISALRSVAPSGVPRATDISSDLRVAVFAFLLAGLTVVVFGLVPALRASRVDINMLLQTTSDRAGVDAGRVKARNLLIGAEIALSVVLLAGAVLLMRSFVVLRSVDPGFDPTNVLTFKMSPSPRYSTTTLLWDFERRVLVRFDALPGVDTAAVAICLPLQMGPDIPTEIVGQPQTSALNPHYRTVSPDYFRSLKIPIVLGRPFTDADVSDSTPVIIINEAMARSSFRNHNPLGEHLQLGVGLGAQYADPPRIIVGVAGDVRESSLDQPARETVFIPRSQVPTALTADINRLAGASWAIKGSIPPTQLANAVRQTVLAIDPQQPISAIRTMKEAMSSTIERQQFTAVLMILFAAFGVVLAAVGTYGVVSCTVAQRTHEIGIRRAVGAKGRDVVTLILLEALRPALVGAIFGIAGALVLSRVLASELYDVSPRDPLTLASVAVSLIVVTLVASYIPARRATTVDPMVALRHE
jgi:putative ABC transport system permease protein